MTNYDTLVILNKKSYPFFDQTINNLSEIRLVNPCIFSSINDEFLASLEDCEILITGWGAPTIDLDLIKSSKNLKLISHMAGSIRSAIDKNVFESGVRVCHAAGANAVPTAEFSFAMIILAGKKTFRYTNDYYLHKKKNIPKDINEIGNYKKVVGLISASKVGRHVLKMLEMTDFEVLVYDPYANPIIESEFNCKLVTLEKLLTSSSIISLHAPNIPSTQKMIGKKELSLMHDGTTLINTARGAILDHEALLDELVSGRLNAILDVTNPEPLNTDSTFWHLDNVYLTPHIAGSHGNEISKMTEFITDELRRFVNGEKLLGEIISDDYDLLA